MAWSRLGVDASERHNIQVNQSSFRCDATTQDRSRAFAIQNRQRAVAIPGWCFKRSFLLNVVRIALVAQHLEVESFFCTESFSVSEVVRGYIMDCTTNFCIRRQAEEALETPGPCRAQYVAHGAVTPLLWARCIVSFHDLSFHKNQPANQYRIVPSSDYHLDVNATGFVIYRVFF